MNNSILNNFCSYLDFYPVWNWTRIYNITNATETYIPAIKNKLWCIIVSTFLDRQHHLTQEENSE